MDNVKPNTYIYIYKHRLESWPTINLPHATHWCCKNLY